MIKHAVILAAGKSTRMYPLTVTRPKPLLRIANKTLLEHTLDQLSSLVSEVIIVVHYQKEMIIKSIGKKYKNLSLRYVIQHEPLGTGHALGHAERYVGERCIVLGGDDLFFKGDIRACLKFPSALLAQEVPNPQGYGVVNEKKNVLNCIEEKPLRPTSKLVNTGCYVLTQRIFTYVKALKRSLRGEYELTDALNAYAQKERIAVVRGKHWMPITYPWNLLDAQEKLVESMNMQVKGTVEKGATLKGPIAVGKGTIIKAGSYIEGPVIIGEGCDIGPNCYIRAATAIGNNCKIGNAVEVKNALLFDNVHIGHLSYVGDSILGEGVNLGAGTITANLRHDNKTVKSKHHNELIDSGRRKLGAIIGDGVHTGIHTSIYPGRKLWPHTFTLPGEAVQEDKEE